jgi:2-polyprenyl-3-methyl-5-hydroxy-6-metoxy-1,4-benzoquinol methylase
MSIKCPICDSSDKNKISLLSNNLKVLGDTFPSSATTLVSCSQCGAIYVDTEANQSHFSHYYDSGYSKTISYIETFGKDVTEEYFTNIHDSFKEYITKDSYILDMGAGRGEFSQFLQTLGYNHVIAAEPSKDNYDHMRANHLESLLADTFTIDQKTSLKFDLIILSHTLEHILDFKDALSNLIKLLNDNGIIYIEVPDSEKYDKVDFPSYFFFTFEHIIHFTKSDFENLSKSYGLKLLQMNDYLKCNSYFVINGIFQNGGDIKKTLHSDETKKAVETYLNYSKDKLIPIIKQLEDSQENLILWGIGASTTQLLNDTFDHCNVIQLIDNNPSRQGIEFIIADKKMTIEAPSDVTSMEATIVVLPIMYKKSIIEQIQALGFKNKIITLE